MNGWMGVVQHKDLLRAQSIMLPLKIHIINLSPLSASRPLFTELRCVSTANDSFFLLQEEEARTLSFLKFRLCVNHVMKGILV